jgi:hypothetical protein
MAMFMYVCLTAPLVAIKLEGGMDGATVGPKMPTLALDIGEIQLITLLLSL